jgi:hypothetical protein
MALLKDEVQQGLPVLMGRRYMMLYPILSEGSGDRHRQIIRVGFAALVLIEVFDAWVIPVILVHKHIEAKPDCGVG